MSLVVTNQIYCPFIIVAHDIANVSFSDKMEMAKTLENLQIIYYCDTKKVEILAKIIIFQSILTFQLKSSKCM